MRRPERPQRPDAEGNGALSDRAGNLKSGSTLADRLSAAAHHHGLTGFPNHEPSFWLRSRLIDIETRVQAGTLRQCGHLGAHGRASVALWAMVARCRRCVHADRLHGPEDKTCDRCGHVCEGIIHPGAVAVGPFVVIFGLCPACHRREVAA